MIDIKGKKVPIAILDFGSQLTHLISRRLRDHGIYCEIFSPNISVSELQSMNIRGLILSGGPSSVYEEDVPEFNESILDMDLPILGVCYGYQLMSKLLGGTVIPPEEREYGRTKITIVADSVIFNGLQRPQIVWMSHGDSVKDLPKGFIKTASSLHCLNAAAENSIMKRYGLQFHPEVAQTENGQQMLVNFAVGICGCKPMWDMKSYLETITNHITEVVGDRSVFLLFSGGIDSTVVYILLNKVLGQTRVKGLFINTGLLRPGDPESINQLLATQGISNYLAVDASIDFLNSLKTISDPERKRNIIGHLFLDVKDRIMAELNLDSNQWILAQGTIYPDVITSGSSQHASMIKTHHNALPSLMNMEVLEPLRYLYKDEVRKLAKELGLPDDFIWKHPFPGPGIAVRIAGMITENKIKLYHKLDKIVLHHLISSGWYPRLWMGFPILIDMLESSEQNIRFPESSLAKISNIVKDDLEQFKIPYDGLDVSILPIRSVGVKGDHRTYEHPVELRLQRRGLRCHVSHGVIEGISNEITNKVEVVNRVLLTLKWSGDPKQWDKIVVLRMLLSVDTLTSDWAKLEQDLLDMIAADIMKLGGGIDAVLLDITQKPPGTMEWE